MAVLRQARRPLYTTGAPTNGPFVLLPAAFQWLLHLSILTGQIWNRVVHAQVAV